MLVWWFFVCACVLYTLTVLVNISINFAPVVSLSVFGIQWQEYIAVRFVLLFVSLVVFGQIIKTPFTYQVHTTAASVTDAVTTTTTTIATTTTIVHMTTTTTTMMMIITRPR